MIQTFAEMRKEDGTYELNGIIYDDVCSCILEGVFGWCGCGCPNDAMKYVRHCLRYLNEEGTDSIKAIDEYFA